MLNRDENKDLNKITITSLPYQPLFDEKQFEDLKLISKQVFISPIYNWQLFAVLKKRLEIAYKIRQDLKFMLREQEFKFKENASGAKLKMSRVGPYIAQYWSNCRVKGLYEID